MARVVLPDPEGPTIATREPGRDIEPNVAEHRFPRRPPDREAARGQVVGRLRQRHGRERLGDRGGSCEYLRDPVARRAKPRDFLRGRPEPGEDLVGGQRREHDDREQHPGQGARADRGNGEAHRAQQRRSGRERADRGRGASPVSRTGRCLAHLPALVLDGGERPARRAERGQLGRAVEQRVGRRGEVAAQRGEVAFLPAGERDRGGRGGEGRHDQRRREDQPCLRLQGRDQRNRTRASDRGGGVGQPHPEPLVGQ